MDGIVTEWTQTWEFSSGTIETAGNDWWRVLSGKDVQTDSIGRCFLVPGEPVEFEPSHATKPNKSKSFRVARNVRRPWREMNIDPSSHRELCIVKDDLWLVRQLGGLLFAGDALEGFKVGSIVECGVRQDGNFHNWQAKDIRWVADSEAEVDWNSQEIP